MARSRASLEREDRPALLPVSRTADFTIGAALFNAAISVQNENGNIHITLADVATLRSDTPRGMFCRLRVAWPGPFVVSIAPEIAGQMRSQPGLVGWNANTSPVYLGYSAALADEAEFYIFRWSSNFWNVVGPCRATAEFEGGIGSGTGEGGGHQIQNNGLPVTQRAALNFGTGLDASDDGANDRTNVVLGAHQHTLSDVTDSGELAALDEADLPGTTADFRGAGAETMGAAFAAVSGGALTVDQYDLLARLPAGAGAPAGVAAGDLTAGTPVAGVSLLGWLAGGELRKFDVGDLPAGTVGTSGTPANGEFARFTDADTIEGRSASQTRSDLSLVIGTNVASHVASASQEEMETGTESALRRMSPLRIVQAIAAWISANLGTAAAQAVEFFVQTSEAGDLAYLNEITPAEIAAAAYASQGEAEAGTENTKVMTSLRVAQAISAGGEASGLQWGAPNAQTLTTYTFVVGDRHVTFSNTSTITATVPNSSAQDFPIGWSIRTQSLNTGRVDFVAAGGVTLLGADILSLSKPNQVGYWTKIATNTWAFHSPTPLFPATTIAGTTDTIDAGANWTFREYTSVDPVTVTVTTGLAPNGEVWLRRTGAGEVTLSGSGVNFTGRLGTDTTYPITGLAILKRIGSSATLLVIEVPQGSAAVLDVGLDIGNVVEVVDLGEGIPGIDLSLIPSLPTEASEAEVVTGTAGNRFISPRRAKYGRGLFGYRDGTATGVIDEAVDQGRLVDVDDNQVLYNTWGAAVSGTAERIYAEIENVGATAVTLTLSDGEDETPGTPPAPGTATAAVRFVASQATTSGVTLVAGFASDDIFRLYLAQTTGTAGATEPSHTTGTVAVDGIDWLMVRALGTIDGDQLSVTLLPGARGLIESASNGGTAPNIRTKGFGTVSDFRGADIINAGSISAGGNINTIVSGGAAQFGVHTLTDHTVSVVWSQNNAEHLWRAQVETDGNWTLRDVIAGTNRMTVDSTGKFSFFDNLITRQVLQDYSETSVTASVSGAVSRNYEDGGILDLTMTGNVTDFAITNAPNGANLTLIRRQDGTGGRTWAWGGEFEFPGGTPPSVTSAANSKDVFAFVRVNGAWLPGGLDIQ